MKDRGTATMIALALIAALVLAIAYREDSGTPSAKPKVIAIFKTGDASNAFWNSVSEGVTSGAQDFGFDITIRAPRDEIYIDEQIDIMLKAIAERPAAIVLAACDVHRLVDPVRKAKARGIKVVCIDSFIETEDADAKVGTDNFEAGQKCGAALLRLLPEGARIAVMSYVQGSSTAIGRESGLLDALGDKLAIASTSYSSSDESIAYRQAAALLARDPSISGIATLNLPTTLGAARALQESGLQSRIALVAFDDSPEVMRLIERGVIRDAVVQKPFNMGYITMRTVSELLAGKRPSAYTNTGSVDIDKVDMFEPENEKLLFPVGGQ